MATEEDNDVRTVAAALASTEASQGRSPAHLRQMAKALVLAERFTRTRDAEPLGDALASLLSGTGPAADEPLGLPLSRAAEGLKRQMAPGYFRRELDVCIARLRRGRRAAPVSAEDDAQQQQRERVVDLLGPAAELVALVGRAADPQDDDITDDDAVSALQRTICDTPSASALAGVAVSLWEAVQEVGSCAELSARLAQRLANVLTFGDVADDDDDGASGHTAEDSEEERASDVAAAQRGVSVALVLGWARWLRAQVNDENAFSRMTCYDAVNGFEGEESGWSVCAVVQGSELGLADKLRAPSGRALLQAMLPDGSDKDDDEELFGHAHMFMSHAWETPVRVLADALADPSLRGTRLWLDIFALPQASLVTSSADTRRLQLLPRTRAVISACDRGLLLLAHPWRQPTALRRTWCWAEIAMAAAADKPIALALAHADADGLRQLAERVAQEDDVAAVADMLRDLSVAKSQCTRADDRARLLEFIDEAHGVQAVDRLVKNAVGEVLLRTADALVAKHLASPGAVGLVDAVLTATATSSGAVRIEHAARLARLQVTLGHYENGAARLQTPIAQLRAQLQRERAESLERELALALTLRGRLLGDAISQDTVDGAVADLEEAAQLREQLHDAGLHESLYNLGRTLVLCHESYSDPQSARDRARDLARAESVLRRSVALQEAMSPTPGSLGAACVLLAKALDLVGEQEDNGERALALFERGKEVQLRVYGYEDARWAMTEQSLAWHLITHRQHALALPRLALAHAHLLRRVLGVGGRATGCPPVRILYLLDMIRGALQSLQGRERRLEERFANEARRFLRWLGTAHPDLLAAREGKEVAALRAWAARTATNNIVLVAVRGTSARNSVLETLRGLAREEGAVDAFVVEVWGAGQRGSADNKCGLLIADDAGMDAAEAGKVLQIPVSAQSVRAHLPRVAYPELLCACYTTAN